MQNLKLVIFFEGGIMKEFSNLTLFLLEVYQKSNDIDRIIVFGLDKNGETIFQKQFVACR